MSTQVRSTTATPPEVRLSRALRVAKNVTYVVWGLSAMMVAVTLIAIVGVYVQTGHIAQPESGIKGVMATVGNLISSTMMAFVYWHIAKLFDETSLSGSPFGASQSRRMRAIAAILLAAGMFQLAAIIVACAMGYGAFGGFVIMNLPGLELFGNMFGNTGDLGGYAYLDITVFLLAAIAWGLSFVFEYGGYLQAENDFTV